MPLKFEKIARIGEKIRAYDFEPMSHRPDSYIEGVVESSGIVGGGYKAFTVQCTFDSTADPTEKYTRIGRRVFVPMEVFMMEWDGRVVNLDHF